MSDHRGIRGVHVPSIISIQAFLLPEDEGGKGAKRREARKEKRRREEGEDEYIPMMISSQPNSDIQSPL
jgi:hypothetical protein